MILFVIHSPTKMNKTTNQFKAEWSILCVCVGGGGGGGQGEVVIATSGVECVWG